MRVEELMRAASSKRESTGVGANGFRPNVPLNLTEAVCEEFVIFLAKAEQYWHRPMQDSTPYSCSFQACHQ